MPSAPAPAATFLPTSSTSSSTPVLTGQRSLPGLAALGGGGGAATPPGATPAGNGAKPRTPTAVFTAAATASETTLSLPISSCGFGCAPPPTSLIVNLQESRLA